MKKTILLFITAWSCIAIWAQSPESFKYQVVVRDSGGELITNTAVNFQMSIRNGSPTGALLYREQHQDVYTNNYGLVSLNIGEGLVNQGNFSTINWGSGTKYLEVEFDNVPQDGVDNYVSMGTAQFLSVPFALHAETVTNNDDGDWEVDGSDIYAAVSGNVGIGTDEPNARLEVFKESFIGSDGNVETNELIGSLGWYNNDANSLNQMVGGIDMKNTGNHWWDGSTQYLDASMLFNVMDNAVVSEAMRISNNGNIGIGITTPVEKLDVNGNIKAISFVGDGSQLTGVGSDNLGNHTATQNIRLNGNWLSGDGGNEGVYVNSTGNVGIGVNSPAYKLDVSGSLRAIAFIGDGSGLTGISGDNLGNHTATQTLNMVNNRIINLAIPSSPGDAATKSYVDAQTGADGDWGINGNNVFTGFGSYPLGNVGIGTDNPVNARLEISNSPGSGIRVNNPGHNGLWIEQPAINGVYINTPQYYGYAVEHAVLGGLYVDQSGDNGIYVDHSGHDGVVIDNSSYYAIDINGTGFSGLRIQGTATHGIDIYNPGNDGVQVTGAAYNGFTASNSNQYGVYVNGADNHGIKTEAYGDGLNADTYDGYFEWGVYTNDKISAMNITTKGMNINGKFVGNGILEEGDLVCIAGGYEENLLFDGDKPVIFVEKINGNNTDQVIGVVDYKVVVREDQVKIGNSFKTDKSFRHDDGIINNGEYLSIIVYGPADVKVAMGEKIESGQKLKAAPNGVIKVNQVMVNGIQISENTGLIGKALEPGRGEKIKVFVNCK